MFIQNLLSALAWLASAAIPVLILWHRKQSTGGLIGWCLAAGLLMSATFWMANNHPDLNDLPGWEWCFAGGAGGYRFGYIYREYFDSPREVKIVSEAGVAIEAAWNCPQEEVSDGLAP